MAAQYVRVRVRQSHLSKPAAIACHTSHTVRWGLAPPFSVQIDSYIRNLCISGTLQTCHMDCACPWINNHARLAGFWCFAELQPAPRGLRRQAYYSYSDIGKQPLAAFLARLRGKGPPAGPWAGLAWPAMVRTARAAHGRGCMRWQRLRRGVCARLTEWARATCDAPDAVAGARGPRGSRASRARGRPGQAEAAARMRAACCVGVCCASGHRCS